MSRTKQTPRWPLFFEQLSFHSVPSLAGFMILSSVAMILLIHLWSLLLDFPCATPGLLLPCQPWIAPDSLFYSSPLLSQACFICLILLQSLLYFQCATQGTPIAPQCPDSLFWNVPSVCLMACPPYSPPLPSSACFIRLILLLICLSLLLDFQCATQATQIAQDHLFLNVSCAILQFTVGWRIAHWMKKWRCFVLSELWAGPLAYLWMGPKQKAVYAIPSCA